MKVKKLKVLSAILAVVLVCALIKVVFFPESGFMGKPVTIKRSAHTVGPQCVIKMGGGQPEPYCGDLVSMAAVNVREARLQLVTEDFDFPWAFEFIDDAHALVTELGGQVKIVNVETGKVTSIGSVPDVVSGSNQLGLLDVVLDPDFERNNLVYFSYTARKQADEELYALTVVSAELQANELGNFKEIFVASPFWHTTANFGGALLFDDQGYLLIASGGRGALKHIQDPRSLLGKIVRLTADGGVPESNPSNEDSSYHPAIYALGVRNPQGLAMDPGNGRIYETEHGPMGGDEINIIEAGNNYGWPITSYGMNYNYEKIGLDEESSLFDKPLFYYLPSIAISPIEVYRGEMFSEWNGNLLAGALRGKAISKLDVRDGRVLSESKILSEAGARVRDIKVARDGSIFFVLEEGQLYRLSRDQAEPGANSIVGDRSGEEIYRYYCRTCHSVTSPGIPKLHSKSDWKARLAKGNEQLYDNAINGFQGMPPRGFCSDCTGDEIKAAVDYMLNAVR